MIMITDYWIFYYLPNYRNINKTLTKRQRIEIFQNTIITYYAAKRQRIEMRSNFKALHVLHKTLYLKIPAFYEDHLRLRFL